MSGPVVDHRKVAVNAMMYPREKVEEDVCVVSMSDKKSPAVAGLFRQYWDLYLIINKNSPHVLIKCGEFLL